MRYAAIMLMIVLLGVPALAQFHFDLNGAFIGVGKSKDQLGGGGAIGITIIDNLSVLYRGMYTEAYRSSVYFGRSKFTHMTHHAGVEYVFNIPVVRLGWRNAFMAGYSYSRMDMADRETSFMEDVVLQFLAPGPVLLLNYYRIRHKRDAGLAMALWTGIQVNALPFLAPFADIGIHKSFYFRELSGREIIGFHFIFGIRFMFGKSGEEN